MIFPKLHVHTTSFSDPHKIFVWIFQTVPLKTLHFLSCSFRLPPAAIFLFFLQKRQQMSSVSFVLVNCCQTDNPGTAPVQLVLQAALLLSRQWSRKKTCLFLHCTTHTTVTTPIGISSTGEVFLSHISAEVTSATTQAIETRAPQVCTESVCRQIFLPVTSPTNVFIAQ